jgi:hypothetical protein
MRYRPMLAGAAAIAVVAAPVAAGAVGGQGRREAAAAGSRVIRIDATASDCPCFSRPTVRARPGRATLVMRNPRSNTIRHGIALKHGGFDRKGRVVGPGGTSRVTVTLRRGRRYTYYCPVHNRSDGMNGVLTVR